MRHLTRRGIVAGGTLLAAGLARPALAQPAFPDRPVTLVVPWPAGGGTDVIGRLVAEAAQPFLGVPVVVVNRVGASGAIGLREVSQAAPDGLMLGLASNAFIGNQYSNANANVLADFDWLCFIGEDPAAITVRAETGIQTIAELVRAARERPGQIRNANDPPAGSTFVWIVMFERLTGTRIVRVNYAGFAPSVTALLSGEVQMTTVPLTDVLEHHRSGRVRSLGVASDHRHFLAPEVPTLREQGIDLVAGAFRALCAPRGTPPERLRRLEQAFIQGMQSAEFTARAQRLGFDIAPKPGAQALALLQARDAEIYTVMSEANMVRVRAR